MRGVREGLHGGSPRPRHPISGRYATPLPKHPKYSANLLAFWLDGALYNSGTPIGVPAQAMTRPWNPGAIVFLLPVLLSATAPADATARSGGLQLEVPAAAPGTALDISGSGLDGTNTQVTIGGRSTEVLSGDNDHVRIVVPDVAPGRKRVVARTAAGKLTGRLRVLRAFDGSLKVKADHRHAATAMIGAGGGSVSTQAGDVMYALEIPAGALAADTEITLTPAA